MIIFPAIDIINGKCVRLTQGKYDEKTIYSDEPWETAQRWQSKGAEFLHVVDLDGAKQGKPVNCETIKRIINSVNIPVQIGGGIRTIEHIKAAFESGVARVILGTSAVNDRPFVEKALGMYGDKIAIGIDAKNGYAAVSGWEVTSNIAAVQLACTMQLLGAKTIIYTDISKDGMLAGPNLNAMKEMVESTSMNVIASGGISSIDDVINLKKTGVAGAIIGKALYTGAIELDEAIKAAK